jgi:acyl-CoA synthetase (AMP-forming)/AMP-acid ligase II
VPALQPGVKVLLPVGTGLIFSLLAVMASGAVPVLPPAARPSNLLRIIRKEKIRVVFTGKNLPFPIRWLAKALGLSLVNMNEMTNSSGAWLPPQQVPPDQPALITHSSGSTGSSKVIYRSHCVLTAQHLALKTAFPPRPEQHDFPLFPNILLHNLAVGTATVFPDLPGFSVLRMAPARIVGQILSNGIQT